MTEKYLKGSYTVENAVILPILLMIILLLLSLAFFVHDTIVIKAITWKTIASMDEYSSDSKALKEITEKGEDEIRKDTFSLKAVKMNLTVNDNGIKAITSYSVGLPGLNRIEEETVDYEKNNLAMSYRKIKTMKRIISE